MDIRKNREQFLIDILEEAKRLIIARSVVLDHGLHRFKTPSTKEKAGYTPNIHSLLNTELENVFLTGLMICMGYRVPAEELYELNDYSELVEWLGEAGDKNKRWNCG